MHLALFAPVGAATPPDHAENGAELRDRRQQANHDVATAGVEALQDLRRPDINGAEGIGQAEVGEGIHQHRWRQYFAQRGTRRSRDDRRMFPFAIDHRLQRLFLFVIQPVGFIRRVVEEEPGDDAEHHRRQAFQQKQPLPAFQVPQAVERQNIAGKYRAEHHGHRHGDHKQGVGAGAMVGREPPGQIDEDPW